jgi:RNA polymerase sigma-70 factor (ECF subfamily)
MIPDPYEERLIVRFRDGDPRALEALFDRYLDRALGLAVRLTETREDAEEVVGEAFLRALRHARQVRGESGRFGPWLYAIVRSVAADQRRQLRLPTLSIDAAEAEASRHTTEDEALRRAQRRALLDALDALPEEYQVVLTLCDLQELAHAEAAKVLGRSTAATKSLLYRARRALRDRMTNR